MRSPDQSHKIVTLTELAALVAEAKAQGNKVVHCHGVFDLLHPGHIKHFQAARRLGDMLVVTVTPDKHVNKGPGRPAFNQRLRAETLASLECVDYVALNEWPTAIETIRLLKPSFYVKGNDYQNPEDDLTGKIVEEERVVKEVGGEIHFTDEITFSSSRLLNLYFNPYPEETENFLREFRQSYSGQEVVERLSTLSTLKVLVVGEAIIDEYCFVKPLGKSPKEAILSTAYEWEEAHAGGALAIANHLAGFCQEVSLVTCLGATDSREEFVRSHLRPNVHPYFLVRPGAPTIVKRRFLESAFLTKLFEVQFLEDTPFPASAVEDVCNRLGGIIGDYDLVLIADYGHGFLELPLREALRRGSRFLAVNAQTNSANLGFNPVTKYPRVDFVCVDEPELRLAMGDKFAGVEELVRALAERLGCQAVIATLGHRGALTYGGGMFHRLPVLSTEVKDRMGAGDAYFSLASLCLAGGFPVELAGFIGNAAGALAVRILGNKTPVEPVALFKFLEAMLK